MKIKHPIHLNPIYQVMIISQMEKYMKTTKLWLK